MGGTERCATTRPQSHLPSAFPEGASTGALGRAGLPRQDNTLAQGAGRHSAAQRVARDNGGRYEYYACSGRQKHGPKACRNERLPRHKLEHAVLKQLAALYRDGDLVAEALAQAEQEAERSRPEIEQRLASIGAEIARAEQALERYYEAFEQQALPERCDVRFLRLQARLEDLRVQQAELALSSPHEAGHGPTPADLVSPRRHLPLFPARRRTSARHRRPGRPSVPCAGTSPTRCTPPGRSWG
jgi:Recombinase zinc beta ribbon domain